MRKPNPDLARRIRSMVSKESNTAFLRSLPVFQVKPLPRKFVDLLQQLDHEENNAGEAEKPNPPSGTN